MLAYIRPAALLSDAGDVCSDLITSIRKTLRLRTSFSSVEIKELIVAIAPLLRTIASLMAESQQVRAYHMCA